jgi:hypothetical protein
VLFEEIVLFGQSLKALSLLRFEFAYFVFEFIDILFQTADFLFLLLDFDFEPLDECLQFGNLEFAFFEFLFH